jgi:hypothetical protein
MSAARESGAAAFNDGESFKSCSLKDDDLWQWQKGWLRAHLDKQDSEAKKGGGVLWNRDGSRK